GPAQDVVLAIDDGHLGTLACQAQGGDQAGRASTDNDDAFTFVHVESPWLLFLGSNEGTVWRSGRIVLGAVEDSSADAAWEYLPKDSRVPFVDLDQPVG